MTDQQQKLNQEAFEKVLATLKAVPKEERAETLKASGILTESGELAPPYAYTPPPAGEAPVPEPEPEPAT